MAGDSFKINPDAAGLDAARLSRIDEHLQTRYIEPGKIAGCQVLVYRHGAVGYFKSFGLMDRERNQPVTEDTIWRVYSMTKPITAIALLTLYERGHFQLNDPVTAFIPSWRGKKVESPDGSLVEPETPMTVKHLLMHMSGLGYDVTSSRDISEFVDAGETPMMEWRREGGGTLEDMVERLAEVPLAFHPGTRWRYSVGTDVCARLVEIVSGKPFDEYLEEEIFGPLGMVDSGFFVPDEKADRLAACYVRVNKQLALQDDPSKSPFRRKPRFLGGGGGLVSTTPDYLRFCQMLLNGGELDGVRVLGRKTVELMTANHLPDGRPMTDFVFTGGYGEAGFAGLGFGLAVAVHLGPERSGVIGSAGEFRWGGMASTAFWVDPKEELIAIFMTQLIPSQTFDFRGQLRSLVYPAISD